MALVTRGLPRFGLPFSSSGRVTHLSTSGRRTAPLCSESTDRRRPVVSPRNGTFILPEDRSCAVLLLLLGECKHCGASLGRHAPFLSMETKSKSSSRAKSCLFEEMSKISGYLPSNAR